MIYKPKCNGKCEKCEGFEQISYGRKQKGIEPRQICICHVTKGYGEICVDCGECSPA